MVANLEQFEDRSGFAFAELRERLHFVREARVLGGRTAGRRAWKMVGLPDVFSNRPAQEQVAAPLADHGGDDAIWPFIRARVKVGGDMRRDRVAASDLYAAYREWCVEGGEPMLSVRDFKAAMIDRGFQSIASDGMKWLGMTLVAELV